MIARVLRLASRVFPSSQDAAWFRLSMAACALLLAWAFYVGFNAISTRIHFSHLDRMQPLSLGDHIALTSYGYGSSRSAESGTRPVLLPQVLVVNQEAHAVLRDWGRADAAGISGQSDLNGVSLAAAYEILEKELKSPVGPNPPARPKELFARYVFYAVKLLRAKHWLQTTETSVTDKDRALAREMRNQFFQRNPLILTSTEIGGLFQWIDENEAVLESNLTRGKSPWRVLESKKAVEAYEADLRRFYPLQANAHLIDFDAPTEAMLPPAGPVLSILYFPKSRGGGSAPVATQPAPTTQPKDNKKEDPKSKEPPKAEDKKTPEPVLTPPPATASSQYCYALEVRPVGGWSGWRLEARYLLYDLDNTHQPIALTRQPAITVMERGSGWWGFRPAAVVTTESQLAARFWTNLDTLRDGAGIKPELKPEQTAVYTQFVEKLLSDRLGRPGKNSLDSEPMDKWVVWPRRLNGGTGWGVIQFAVVVLSIGFLLEFARLGLMIRAARQQATPGVLVEPDMRLPPDLAQLANAVSSAPTPEASRTARADLVLGIESRMHTIRYLVAALPLIGFLGSVAGLSNSLVGSSAVSSPDLTARQGALQAMQVALGTAFDKSMLAFLAAIFCLFLLSRLYKWTDRLRLG